MREAIGAGRGRPEAGWIAPVGDTVALGAALAAALAAARSPGRGDRMRAELRWRVEHWFSPERTIEHTERVLAGVAADGAEAPW